MSLNQFIITCIALLLAKPVFSQDLSQIISNRSMLGYKINAYEYLAVSAVFAPLTNLEDLSTPQGITLGTDLGIGGVSSSIGYSFQSASHALNPRFVYFRKFDRETYRESAEWAGMEMVFLWTQDMPANISFGIVSPLGHPTREWRMSFGVGLGW
jgi:hypothetical protein